MAIQGDDLTSLMLYSVSQKNPPRNFVTFLFANGWKFLVQVLQAHCIVPVYAGLQIFIQLSATLTKLCHIKRDHHNVLKMSTIDRNARWVVALNMDNFVTFGDN